MIKLVPSYCPITAMWAVDTVLFASHHNTDVCATQNQAVVDTLVYWFTT